ncbi:MAG: hypothetical protein FDZ75_02615 [Actinobacteria bacterium]|nr:MAG: hypothetical protein FDZ75_02615 [Actinomycetota bacterium]
MRVVRGAAIAYSAVTAAVVAFQLALAAGVPWGAYAMGGAFPGAFPPALRIAAVVQAILLGAVALVVLARAGVAMCTWERASARLIWAVVALSSVGLVLNLITQSVGERAIWAPVAAVQLGCVLVVAFGARRADPRGSA